MGIEGALPADLELRAGGPPTTSQPARPSIRGGVVIVATVVMVVVMPISRPDKLLAAALSLATKAVEERASGEDLEELAAVILELDEAIVVEGEAAPRRWRGRRV